MDTKQYIETNDTLDKLKSDKKIFEFLRENLKLDTILENDYYSSWTTVKLLLINPETKESEEISSVEIF